MVLDDKSIIAATQRAANRRCDILKRGTQGHPTNPPGLQPFKRSCAGSLVVYSGERPYRPRFALVETTDKRAVVKINDVGPLKPGRIIDLNEQAMRYFDPTMQRGIIKSVKVTPLPGEDWTAGPT